MDIPNEWHFLSRDNLDLYARSWPTEGAARGVIVLVHGFAEHMGRYEHVGAHFAKHGFATYALDLPGHGKSEGERHIIRSFAPHLDAIRQLLDEAKKRGPGLPVFLIGHSMGGMLVTLLVVTSQPGVAGVVLSGPALPSGANLGLPSRMMAKFGKVAPWLPMKPLAAPSVSRDPEVVAAYKADSLVFRGRLRLGTIRAFVRAAQRIDRDMEKFSLPLFIVHGSEDALAAPAGSERLIARASSTHKALKVYEGLFHEVFNEPERDTVLNDVTTWLEARNIP